MATILVVEDSLTQSTHIRLTLKKSGYDVYVAEHGRQALDLLAQHDIHLVLTDMQMPEMDGLELVESMREEHPHVPVVLMTYHGSEDIAMRALRNGASSYMPKDRLNTALIDTVEEILEAAKQADRMQQVRDLLVEQVLRFQIDNDPALIPAIASYVEQGLAVREFADETVRRQMGVAIRQALDNAVFHGNLELGAAIREEGELVYRDEAEKRREQEPYNGRSVWLTITIDAAKAVFVIEDEGAGFDVAALPDAQDPIALAPDAGRGLVLIRAFMDEVRHNDAGNELTMVKRRNTAAAAPTDRLLVAGSHRGPAKPNGAPALFHMEDIAGVLVVTVVCEAVGFAEDQREREMRDIVARIERDNVQNILVDLSPLDYISSAVLESMRAMWNEIRETGQMAVCHASDQAREVLDLSRFDTVWKVYTTRTEAIAALAEVS